MKFARLIAWLAVAAVALGVAACGTKPLGTRAIEERFLDDGYANRMYNYGNDLAAQGRFNEAHAAYLAAESNAYTRAMREAARVRRVYMEKVIAAAERGKPPPPPPFFKPPPPVPPPEVQATPLTSDEEKKVKAEQEAAQDEALRRMYPHAFPPAGSGSPSESPLGPESPAK